MTKSFLTGKYFFKVIIINQKTMKQKLIQAVLFGSCMAFAVSCGQAPTARGEAEYSVMTISTSDVTIPSTHSATIRGRQDIAIYPQVSGTISKVCVKEGEVVRQGQLLFIIDQVPYKAALQTAKANVAAAEASVATAQLTYDSKKELFAKNVVSQFDLQTSQNNLLTAKSQLAQAEAQLVNAANNLSYTEVKSPSNGVVGVLPYRVGALVSASIPQPLTTVSDNSDMYVYFSLTENQLLDLTREYGSMDKALAALPNVQLVLNDGSLYSQEGRIESISGVIDTSTGSVQLRAVFPNPGRLLHSGSSGNVLLPHIYKNVVTVPQVATFELQDKKFVYKVENGVATSQNITVSPQSDGKNFIVTAGLTPGEVIVTKRRSDARRNPDQTQRSRNDRDRSCRTTYKRAVKYDTKTFHRPPGIGGGHFHRNRPGRYYRCCDAPRRAVPRHRAPDGDGACQLSGRQRRNHPEERHHSA